MAKMIESHEIIARSLELTPTAPWPAGDERGMANAIGPGTWLRAAQHLAAPRAKCYELSHPDLQHHAEFALRQAAEISSACHARHQKFAPRFEHGGDVWSGEPGAQGTHMDALGHFGALAAAWNGTEPFPADSVKYYGGHDQSAVKPDPLGTLAKLGIDKAAPIITTAVLLDAQRFIGTGKSLEPGYAVTAKDIDTMLARQGLSERGILPGDVLYIHTGWGVRWKDPDVDKIYYTQGPGLSYDGAHLAQEKGVALVALDNPFTDAVRAGMLRGEAHHCR